MTILKTNIINDILKNLHFSDGSSALSRASDLIIKEGDAGFSLDISGLDLPEAEEMRGKIIDVVQNTQALNKISVVLTSQKKPQEKEQEQQKSKIHIPGVKNTLLIASGKGGVGKSTIASLYAYKLKKQGFRVGIIDADIYGPSIPSIFGLSGKPDVQDKRMVPLEKNGIKINSIAFLSEEGAAISWRGPMVSKALYQLLSLTDWGQLDYLIIDSPPGTGDIHLSLLQNYVIDQAIMITSPQKISAIDVDRAINLYKKFDIHIETIIENMSYLENESGEKIEIFKGTAATDLAKKHDIKHIIKLPIMPGLAAACDKQEELGEFIEKL